MARGRLTEEEIKILKENPYVNDISEIGIRYTNEFKFHFMKEYLSGKKPTQIFKEAGMDPKILGSKRIERAAHRWRESYAGGCLGSYQDSNFRRKCCLDVEMMMEGLSFEDCKNILVNQQMEIERLKRENQYLRSTLSGEYKE